MATSTHTEAPAGGKKNFPPFMPETFASQLVWLAIAFIAIYLIVARMVVPQVGGILEARKNRVEGDLADAAEHRKQADAALAAYEKSLADARDRAQTVANETRDRLNVQSEKARHELEVKLNVKLADAEKTIAATKTAAMTNVRGIATDAAAAIVQRLIGAAPASTAVHAAVADALKR